MLRFNAEIIYDEETITKMDNVRTSSFQFSRKLVFLLLCIVLIIGGVILGAGTTSGILCIVIGAFLIPSAGSMKSGNARQVLRAMKGKMLRMEYAFTDKNFECKAGDDKTINEYHSVIRLVDDKDYLYLFLSPMQACMIDAKSINPNRVSDFKSFIENKVGLKWTKSVTFRNFSIDQMRFNKKNTRNISK